MKKNSRNLYSSLCSHLMVGWPDNGVLALPANSKVCWFWRNILFIAVHIQHGNGARRMKMKTI